MQIGVEAQRAVENRRVFVVDEDEITRAALQFMLADENETHEFSSFQAALDKGKQWRPDVLLLGIRTMQREGADLPARIREAWADIRIILVCEVQDDTATAAVEALAADDVLSLPFKLEAVRRKVDRQLGRKLEMRIPVVVA